jgi:hypothetical protein
MNISAYNQFKCVLCKYVCIIMHNEYNFYNNTCLCCSAKSGLMKLACLIINKNDFREDSKLAHSPLGPSLINAAHGDRAPFASPDGEQRDVVGRGSHVLARGAEGPLGGRRGSEAVHEVGGRPRSPASRSASPAWNVTAPARCWVQHVHNCLWGGVAHAGSSPTVELVSGPLCPWRKAGGITGRVPGGPQEPG